MPVQSAKGNPASHRMSNSHNKDRRARSWLRGQALKDARRKTQDAAAARNRRLRADGKPTPWMIATQKRFAQRHHVASSS